MSSVFAQRRQKLLSLKALRGSSPAPAHTEEACPACGKAVPRRELVGHCYVCPLCGHHYPVGAYYRLSLILDKGTFRELDAPLASNNPLDFPGYEAKLDGARRRTGMNEGVVTAAGRMADGLRFTPDSLLRNLIAAERPSLPQPELEQMSLFAPV